MFKTYPIMKEVPSLIQLCMYVLVDYHDLLYSFTVLCPSRLFQNKHRPIKNYCYFQKIAVIWEVEKEQQKEI